MTKRYLVLWRDRVDQTNLRVAAARSPQHALLAALRQIERETGEEFDEDRESLEVLTLPDDYELVAKPPKPRLGRK